MKRYNKVNLSLIPNSFKDEARRSMCVICNCLSNEIAFISKCNHVFCNDCLVDMDSTHFHCLIDNTRLSKQRLIMLYPNARLIYTKCSSHSLGCQWIGSIDEYEAHFIKIHPSAIDNQSITLKVNDNNINNSL